MGALKPGAVFYVLGWLLAGLSASMFIPALFALATGDMHNARTFSSSAAVTTFFAGAMIMSLRGREVALEKRGSLLLVALIWTILPIFAAIPIYFSNAADGASASLFEAVSGFTTTGATLLTGLEQAPAAIRIWRALLQWLGGLYTVVAATGIFVTLGVGGMQLQFAAMPHGDGDTLFGRLRQTTRALGSVYAFLTLLCVIALWIAGMPLFEALCHALSTVSTGGFGTRDGSIGAFDSAAIEAVICIFMLLGAMNLTLHWAAVNGRWRTYAADPEARYLALGAAGVVFASIAAVFIVGLEPGYHTLRTAVFNGVSMLTTTGYWRGELPATPLMLALIFIAAMLVGGGTGSTSGGFKLMRLAVLLKHGRLELARLLQPSGILRAHYAKLPVSEAQINAVWSVFILFSFILALITIALGISGLAFEQAVAVAVASLTNTGAPAGMFFLDSLPYSSVSETSRFISMVAMIMGRMEVLTLVTLLNPVFWRG